MCVLSWARGSEIPLLVPTSAALLERWDHRSVVAKFCTANLKSDAVLHL